MQKITLRADLITTWNDQKHKPTTETSLPVHHHQLVQVLGSGSV